MLYDFQNCDFSGLNDHLSDLNWSEILCNLECDNAVDRFYTVLQHAVSIFTPVHRYRKSKYLKWYSPDLKLLNTEKKIYHQAYKKTGNHTEYQKFADACKKCKSPDKRRYKNYINMVQNNIFINTKFFWSHVSNLRKSNYILSTMHLNGMSYDNLPNILDCFANYFSSVYSPNSMST
jgi:hypothetical protein